MFIFNEDILVLVRAIINDPVEYQGGDDESHYWCHYCDAELKDIRYQSTKEDFKHELNCPVLIAQDVLTRIKGE